MRFIYSYRLVHEDVGNLEEELWKNMDTTRKAHIDLAALITEKHEESKKYEETKTTNRLQQMGETQQTPSAMENKLHSSLARCELQLRTLTAKVNSLEKGNCGGEQESGGSGSTKNVPGGGNISHPTPGGETSHLPTPGGESLGVHQLKDAIISVLKGVDTNAYSPNKNGVICGGPWGDNNPIKLTINMKMSPKSEA